MPLRVYIRIESLHTVGANAMAEPRFGSILDVAFKLSPESFIIPDLLAIRTNRDETAERFNIGEGVL